MPVFIEQLISRFNHASSDPHLSQKEIELELRFDFLNKELYKEIFDLIKQDHSASVIHNINVIIPGNQQIFESKRREITKFPEKKVVYTSKIPLMRPVRSNKNIQLPYKVTLSSEERCAPFSVDGTGIVRIKHRTEFKINDKWRIDMTITKQLRCSELNADAGKITPILFVDNPIANIEESDMEFTYEMEAEFIEKNITLSDITEILAYINKLINPDYMKHLRIQQEVYFTSGYIMPNLQHKFHIWGFKQLTPQVKTLTRMDYTEIYPPINYYVTDKADGIHALGIVRANDSIILSGSEVIEFAGKSSEITIVEGEYLNEKFYIYDVLFLEGKNLTQELFEKRILSLGAATDVLSKAGIPCAAKNYLQITLDDIEAMKDIFESAMKNPEYTCDGIILVRPGSCYKDTLTYKWKPIKDNTIDFLAKKAPNNDYWLFVGISATLFKSFNFDLHPLYNTVLFPKNKFSAHYFPVRFQPSTHPKAYIYKTAADIDNKIVELIWNLDESAWNFVKIRSDRDKELKSSTYFGNDFRIAETNWLNYLDPLLWEQMWQGPGSSYFMTTKLDKYKAQTAFNSYVKSQIIKKLTGKEWVLDLGSGKGQDLGRYLNAHVKHLIMSDIDRTALVELVRRKYSFMIDSKFGAHFNTTVYATILDFKAPLNAMLEKIHTFSKTVSGIVANLSIHYALDTSEDMDRIAIFCKNMLTSGGDVLFTLMNGQCIHEKLKGKETLNIEDNKYSIKKMYTNEDLTIGQKVGILLPFSRNEYYEENLVNLELFIKAFTSRGFLLIENKSFAQYFESFSVQNTNVSNTLSDADKEWVSMYSAIHFKVE